MGERTVAGILIERRKAYLVIAEHESSGKGGWPEISLTASQAYMLDRNDKAKTFQQLKGIVGDATYFEPAAVCVGAYGPFVSLAPTGLEQKKSFFRRDHPDFRGSPESRYGQVDPEKGHEPLRGEPLFAHFREWLDECGLKETRVYIDTDANACALGEAFLRKIPDGTLLVYLLVTEGVGAGIVNRYRVLQSALHPEIGLLPVRYFNADPLYKRHPFTGDLGLLASSASMAQRLGNPFISQEDVARLATQEDRRMWRLQAYYLAQACTACTVILAPHKVIVATDIDPDGQLVERVKRAVKYFRREQKKLSPAFSYDELEERDFIDGPRKVDLGKRAHEFGPFYTGAIGMAVKATMQLPFSDVSRIRQ